ncbi:MAG: ribonuclease Z [Ardenticatenales bacterium]
MLEIAFLGTSASAPSVRRGLPAIVVMYRDRRWLIDCGEGTQRQILRSGLGFKRLETVLLTHGHLDHILGLGGLVSTFARWESIDRIAIHGGRSALDRVRDLMGVVLRGDEIAVTVEYNELQPGPIMRAGDLDVVAFPVKHRGSGNFGFLFHERSHRPFLVDTAEALGVPQGPERRHLVQGKSVTLPDGRTITPDEVLGPTTPGVKVMIIGDVARVDELLPIARNADALVCESTYLWEDRAIARQFGHLTARQAAELARDADVGTLFLTHVSRRYAAHQIRQEAQAIFPRTILADDLDVWRVKRGSVERVRVVEDGELRG